MELPPLLRQAVDDALHGTSSGELARASETLSSRYRAEVRDGRMHLSGDMAARAYLAARLPATYAAIHSALAATSEVIPGYTPGSLLDVGAGPGSFLWAATACWPTLAEARMVEASPSIRFRGRKLAEALPVRCEWIDADLTQGLDACPPHDLVGLAYVLNEIPPETRPSLIERLWELTAHILVIVEPGTPAGWQRLMKVRTHLTDLGAHLLAPCPHALPCPVHAPDWCHFSRRVARTRLHRQTKNGTVPWEDEKFIYLAAARQSGVPPAARLIAPPRSASGRVSLTLCRCDGMRCERTITRRNGVSFREARRLDWGDGFHDDASSDPSMT